MGDRVYRERSRKGRGIAWGLTLLLLTACAPSFVKPQGERRVIFPYTAFGSFLVRDSKSSHRGMWEVSARGEREYRLTLYSSVGTLIGCTKVTNDHHLPCKAGMKDLGDTKAWKSLPRELFSRLPALLSGEAGPGAEKGGELTVTTPNNVMMKIKMLQYEDEPFSHPIFIEVRLEKKGCKDCRAYMRIQVEEIERP